MKLADIQAHLEPQRSDTDAWLTAPRFAFLLGLLVFVMFPGTLLGQTCFVVRDFGVFSYPVAYFQRECFWRGEWPLWNPYSHCGVPFLAQWNTMALYPLSLIYLIFPLSWSLSFFCLAHLFFGGLGMYFLARNWTGSRLGAAVAGVIFSFNGLNLNFLMWPSHEATFSWAPWVIWLVQTAWREGGRNLLWAILAAVMQMLAGGPETIFLTWLFLCLLAAGDWLRAGRRGVASSALAEDAAARADGDIGAGFRGPFQSPRFRIPLRFLTIVVFVSLICAIQLLPFLDLVSRSQRDKSYGVSGWEMPVWGWANFLVPLFRTAPTNQGFYLQINQYWTASYYAGVATVFLAAVALRRLRDWRLILIGIVVALALVLALGDAGFLYRVLRRMLPLLGFVRYPVKYVIIILILTPLLAAFGMKALLSGNAADATGGPTPSTPLLGRYELSCAGMIAGLIGLIVLAAWLFPYQNSVWDATWVNGLTRAAILGLAILIIAFVKKSSGRIRIVLGCLLIVVFWLDFDTHIPFQNPGVARTVYAPDWAVAQLEWKPRPRLGQSRAMMSSRALEAFEHHVLPSFEKTYLLDRLAMMGNCNLLDDVPVAYGFFSLMPFHANNVNAMPLVYTNSSFSTLLDLMAVSQISSPSSPLDWSNRPSAMPMVTAGQQPVFAKDDAIVGGFFANTNDFRRIVYLPPEAKGVVSATAQTKAQVISITFENQTVTIQAEAPAPFMLLISQSWYPAWNATVDGAQVKLWRADYAFQAVQVAGGRHVIRLVYEDASFDRGALITAVGICLLLLMCAEQSREWLRDRRLRA